jgi:hypothetical protein
MDDQLFRALLAEYAVLSSSFDKHATVGYSILPLALTAIGGVAILGQSRGPYVGVGASLGLLVVVAWIGSSHALLNRIGLRLVAIELQLRRGLAIDRSEEAFFFTSFIGQGAPGYVVYFPIFGLIACATLVISMMHWWATLTAWHWPVAYRVTGVAVPVALNAAGILTMYLVERRVERQRDALIDVASRVTVPEGPTVQQTGP